MYTCILCRFISTQQILIGCNCWPCSSSSHCKSHLWEACDICCACHPSYDGTSQPILHLLHHWTQQRGVHKGLSVSVLLGPLPLLGMVENMVNLRGLKIFYFIYVIQTLLYDGILWCVICCWFIMLRVMWMSLITICCGCHVECKNLMCESCECPLHILPTPHVFFISETNAMLQASLSCFDYFVSCICF